MQISQTRSKSNDVKIAVLMSTYNGEKYIREQIDSILAQENVKVHLFLRDDGSKDQTRNIIREYCEKVDNITWINEFKNENIGVKRSFLYLLQYVYNRFPDFHYYAFADQDDVWLKNKLVSALSRVALSKNQKGALYYSNKIFVDSNLNEIKKEHINFFDDYLEILWPSLASGCTMVFNKELAYYALQHMPENKCIHDSWIYRLAKCIGSDIIFDEDPKILYRQHESNVCGMETTNLHHGTAYMIKNFLRLMFKSRNHVIQNIIQELYDSFETYMTKEMKRYSQIVLTYNRNPISKIRLLFINGIFRRCIKTQFVWIYKILFNIL